MSKEDPKHGRWILPLVVVGIVAFTFVFVRALEPSDSPAAADTTTTVPPSTTPPAPTTTTLPPLVAAFVEAAEAIQASAANLADEAATANEEWEDGGSYTAALNALRDIAARTEDLSLEVEATTVPDNAAASWAVVQTAADAMVVAGNGMVEGIQAPDSGQIRRAALEDYLTATEDLDAGIIVSIGAAKE
jgi:hypothetical protein